jgi:hypothetical protein
MFGATPNPFNNHARTRILDKKAFKYHFIGIFQLPSAIPDRKNRAPIHPIQDGLNQLERTGFGYYGNLRTFPKMRECLLKAETSYEKGYWGLYGRTRTGPAAGPTPIAVMQAHSHPQFIYHPGLDTGALDSLVRNNPR